MRKTKNKPFKFLNQLVNMSKRTYLTLTFNSEGATVSEISDSLLKLGFKSIKGQYDFVYVWKRTPTVSELIKFAGKVQKALKNKKVLFQMITNE